MSGNATLTFDPALLAEGRCLAERLSGHQWELGELALTVAPVGAHGGDRTAAQLDDRAEFRLREFANAIGVAFKTLNNCRHTAAKWPTKSRRRDLPWSVHSELNSLEDRAKVIETAASEGWTVARTRDYVALQRPRPAHEPQAYGPDDLNDCRCSLCGTPAKHVPLLTRRTKR